MKIEYVELSKHFYDQELIDSLENLFKKCNFILGEEVVAFEKEFAELCNTKYAIGLNSGTDAIFLGLKALNIGLHDEVITVPNSFVATANAIIATGAKPVFVDVGEDYNIDVLKIERAISKKTKAIIPVHLTGNMADMDEINKISEKYGLYVIEDAAQSIYASYNGKRSGSTGTVGCFSLHPLKSLNVAGDGGVLTTDNEEIYKKVLALRNHGLVNRDEIVCFGYNSRLDTIHAIVGAFGLKKIKSITENRIANASIYDASLSKIPACVKIPNRNKKSVQVFHTYVIQVQMRDELQKYLNENNVGTKIHYPIPIHLQKPYKKLGYKEGDFPVSEKQSKNILSLPVHQHLSRKQIEHVCDLIIAFYS